MIILRGRHVYLRILQEDDAAAFTSVLKQNKKYWSIFEPRQDPGFYTISTQRDKIRESIYQMRNRREYNFGIFDNETGRLVGHISLYNIKRLPFLSAFIGYSIDEKETGRGIGTEAVQLVTTFSFEQVSLHRVEAYVSPRNAGSIAVLEKSGYRQEGLLRKLLYINGVWEDHYIYAILEDNF